MDQEQEEQGWFPTCKHTDGVVCAILNRKCKECGWDPDVAKKRLEDICSKLGIQYPLPEIMKEEE